MSISVTQRLTDSRYYLFLEVWEDTYDIATNSSSVRKRIRVIKDGSSTAYNLASTSSYSSNVDGVVASNGAFPYDFRGITEKYLLDTSQTVVHNADGTKTISASCSVNLDGIPGSAAIGTQYLALTTIPRSALHRWDGTAWDAQRLGRYPLDKMQSLDRWNGSSWVRQE